MVIQKKKSPTLGEMLDTKSEDGFNILKIGMFIPGMYALKI